MVIRVMKHNSPPPHPVFGLATTSAAEPMRFITTLGQRRLGCRRPTADTGAARLPLTPGTADALSRLCENHAVADVRNHSLYEFW